MQIFSIIKNNYTRLTKVTQQTIKKNTPNFIKLKGITDEEFLAACKLHTVTVAVGAKTGKRVAKIKPWSGNYITYVFNKEGARLQKIIESRHPSSNKYWILRTKEGLQALKHAGVSKFRSKFQKVEIFKNYYGKLLNKKLAFSSAVDILGNPTIPPSGVLKEIELNIYPCKTQPRITYERMPK